MQEMDWVNPHVKQINDIMFKNTCAFCGSEEGNMRWEWGGGQGEVIGFFKCDKCGKTTAIEKLWLVTAIGEAVR
jgi:hypothetical protein